VFVFTACNQNGLPTNDKQEDTSTSKNNFDKLQGENQTTKRVAFKSAEEVVQDKKSNAWVDLRDSSASLALHFNLSYKDTLCVEYSPECWLMYPFKIGNKKIVVYWDNFNDTKYDFDIVKAINKVDKNYLGKPFMILELINDTTLEASYVFSDLIKKINGSTKERTLFPDKFVVFNF